MARGRKKSAPSSFNGKNKTGDGSSKEAARATVQPDETENQASQELEQEAKKQRRALACRQYSQKYRLKQIDHTMHLEKEVKNLEVEILISSPRIENMDIQNSFLRVENDSINQKLSAFSEELAFKEAEYEKLKREMQILKQLYKVYHPEPEQAELVIPPNQGFNNDI